MGQNPNTSRLIDLLLFFKIMFLQVLWPIKHFNSPRLYRQTTSHFYFCFFTKEKETENMMTNQMEKYEIKFVVELMIYFSVPVASVCLYFLYKKQPHFVHIYPTSVCSLYARLTCVLPELFSNHGIFNSCHLLSHVLFHDIMSTDTDIGDIIFIVFFLNLISTLYAKIVGVGHETQQINDSLLNFMNSSSFLSVD